MGVVYTGIVGRYVIPSLQTADHSIDVISPYLSPRYSQLLLSKARSGVPVRVLTSDANNRRHQQSLRMLRVKSDLYATKRFRYYLGASISFGVVASLILGAFGLILAAIAIIIAVAMGIRTRPRS
ncbi:MAG: hypothetical protein ACLP9D_08415, partial [Candidatus Bathyarchaeia archaeon]